MDFSKFFESLTGYRISEIFLLIGKTSLVEKITESKSNSTASEICRIMGWNRDTGGRFLDVLYSLEILKKDDNRYLPTEFANAFFLKDSKSSQSTSLKFECKLMDSWKTLEEVLINGKRIFNAEEKDESHYKESLEEYITAMDDAARIRAAELWDSLRIDEKGTIVDIGAGSGAFLIEFLRRNKNWDGIFCDLRDVVDLAEEKGRFETLQKRVFFYPCNILDETFGNASFKADIILLSNLIHCYSEKEIEEVLKNLAPILKKDAVIIIHDFFTDSSFHGALYDLHMMLNTWNGKAYSSIEVENFARDAKFYYTVKGELQSHSSFMVCGKTKESVLKFVKRSC